MFEIFGPAERLYAAVRERAPRIAVSIVRNEEEGLPYVHVGPGVVHWDGTSYA